jgi:uncharacterized membrane protein
MKQMSKSLLGQWRANFMTGLLVILPAALSILLVVWVIRNIATITDVLLVFVPSSWTHKDQGKGALYWHSSWLAFFMAVGLITGLGALARIYIGQKLIELADSLLLRVPLLNKVYSTFKQVNEAFSGSKSSFKQVVIIEYPRLGVYTLAFVTNDQPTMLGKGLPEKLVSVFVPTTPNPTSGFIVLLPETALIKANLSVPDGIKFIISLGSLAPEQQQARLAQVQGNKVE